MEFKGSQAVHFINPQGVNSIHAHIGKYCDKDAIMYIIVDQDGKPILMQCLPNTASSVPTPPTYDDLLINKSY